MAQGLWDETSNRQFVGEDGEPISVKPHPERLQRHASDMKHLYILRSHDSRCKSRHHGQEEHKPYLLIADFSIHPSIHHGRSLPDS